MTLTFTKGDVLGQLGADGFRKGSFVLADGGVRHVEASADGKTVSGLVQGTRPRPYQQTIAIKGEGTALVR